MNKCRATVPPEGKVCGADAEYEIEWRPLRENEPAEKTPVCLECARRLKQLAEEEHKMKLSIRRIKVVTV